jgi:hypothetical protein
MNGNRILAFTLDLLKMARSETTFWDRPEHRDPLSDSQNAVSESPFCKDGGYLVLDMVMSLPMTENIQMDAHAESDL